MANKWKNAAGKRTNGDSNKKKGKASRNVSSKGKANGRDNKCSMSRSTRDLMATKRSMRQVSEIVFDNEQELRLLSLIAELDGLTLKSAQHMEKLEFQQREEIRKLKDQRKAEKQAKKESALALPSEAQEVEFEEDEDEEENEEDNEDSEEEDEEALHSNSGESESENDSESESETESDSDSDSSLSLSISQLAITNTLKTTFSHAQFVKKLTRTDRFERKQWRLGGERLRSAESFAAKLRSSISSSTATPSTALSKPLKATNTQEVPLTHTDKSERLMRSVRLIVECEKNRKCSILVVERDISLPALLAQCRAKCHVGSKFNALKIVVSRDVKKKMEKDKSGKSGKSNNNDNNKNNKKSSEGEREGDAAQDESRWLDELDLFTLPDDTRVLLCERVETQQTTCMSERVSESKKAVPLSEEEEKEKESESEESAGEEEELFEQWRPPARERDGEREDPPLRDNATQSLSMKKNLLRAQYARVLSEQRREIEGAIETETERERMRRQRQSLPMFARREDVLRLIDSHRVCVLCGETGSGKSTQVAQLLLQREIERDRGSACRIVVTQPRRIAATSLAQRVHEELYNSFNLLNTRVKSATLGEEREEDERVLSECVSELPLRGEESVSDKSEKRFSCPPLGKGLVGYSVRMDSRQCADTRLLFCTTGVLLRKLQSDSYLRSVSHVVIDEVHERGVETDFIMTILKQKMHQYPHLKLILMSATLQEESFQRYFDNAPVLHVEGRTFPVAMRFLNSFESTIRSSKNPNNAFRANRSEKSSPSPALELPKLDTELIADLVSHIIATDRNNKPVVPGAIPTAAELSRTRGEAILVFLSGIQAIELTHKALKNRELLRRANIRIHLLHGSLSAEHQYRVFKPTCPGEWKIVLATNIAETSITVDDVTHVIDSGFMKEQRFVPSTGIHSLQEVFISRSSAKQRAGRAGRVRPGTCWRMYNEKFFNASAEKIAKYPLSLQIEDFDAPEMQRIALEEVILQVLFLGLGRPESFLLECLSPPTIDQIKAALAILTEIKAVHPQPGFPLTALGWNLAQLPVDVRIGKMLVYGALLDCVDPVLTIAAALSGKSPFQSTPQTREHARAMHTRFLRYREWEQKTTPSATRAATHAVKQDEEDEEDPYPDGDDVLHCRSDHLAVVHAYNLWRETRAREGNDAAYAFCREYFLSAHTMREIDDLRRYYSENLASHGFTVSLPTQTVSRVKATTSVSEKAIAPHSRVVVNDSETNRFDRNLVRCAMCAGFFPNVVRAFRVQDLSSKNVAEKVKIVQKDSRLISFHPSSLLCGQLQELIPDDKQDSFLIFHRKTDIGGQLQVFDATVIPHSALLLFAGHEILLTEPGKKKNHRVTQRVVVQGWVEMALSELHLACFRSVAKEIEKMLRSHVERPEVDLSAKRALIGQVIDILLENCE